MSRNFGAVFYTDAGAPATGLSPTVNVWDKTLGTQVVTGGAATELGGGGYYYDYTTVTGSELNEFFCQFDAGVVAGVSSRYADAWTPAAYDTDVQALLTLAQLLVDLDSGTWELTDPNNLTFYKADGSGAVVARYLCYDIDGNPTTEGIAKVEKQ